MRGLAEYTLLRPASGWPGSEVGHGSSSADLRAEWVVEAASGERKGAADRERGLAVPEAALDAPSDPAARAATLPPVSLVDGLVRAGYRVLYRLALLWWRIRRPTLQGAYVAVWHGGRVLLVRNSYRRKLSLPAGGVARGERPVDAARRELREETGIACDEAALRYVGEIVDQSIYAEDHGHVFELRCADEPSARVDRREVVWAGFLHAEEALAQGVVPVVRTYLERLLADRR
jgi:8-oxo-dGTP pyrophosphatase MutT (NUDIX family)